MIYIYIYSDTYININPFDIYIYIKKKINVYFILISQYD